MPQSVVHPLPARLRGPLAPVDHPPSTAGQAPPRSIPRPPLLIPATLAAACLLAAPLHFAPQSTRAQEAGPLAPPPPPPPPAQSPITTQPATDTVIRYSPLRSLVFHAFAMANGDANGVRSCYVAQTPEERAIVDAYAHLAESIGTLRNAAVDRFGDTGFDAIGFGPLFDEEVKRMEKARFTLNAERAVVHAGPNPDSPPLIMVWQHGWKISVAESFTKSRPRRAARINAQASAYESLAADIAAGQFKLAIEARQAGAQKVAEAMQAAEAELAATTTQPTTRP